MNEFDRLISEQLRTMEKLLLLQSEIEKCQEVSDRDYVREELRQKKNELEEIQEVFEKQTEEVIRHFQLEQTTFS